MRDAATIAVVGICVVMSALTILMLAIMVVTRLAPGSKEAKMKATTKESLDHSSEKESVAVIAVAMALAMEAEKKGPAIDGTAAGAPEPLASRWASAGREQLMQSRKKTERRWGKSSG